MRVVKKLKKVAFDISVNSIASLRVTPKIVRKRIYNLFAMNIQTDKVLSGCVFSAHKVSIGKNSFVNQKCFFEVHNSIEIGNNCDIGMEVLFCSSTHELGNQNKRAGTPYGLPIIVGDGTWIGARSTILPGVTIGKGCIIAAGSVVTKDCQPNAVYAGVPAVKVKDLS